jgi:hypothetical protein
MLKDKLSGIFVRQEVWEYIFIESTMVTYVKICQLRFKDNLKLSPENPLSSEQFLDIFKIFVQLLKNFQLLLGKDIDLQNFSYSISNKFESFFSNCAELFSIVLEKEHKKIAESIRTQKHQQTPSKIPERDLIFDEIFADLLKNQQIRLKVSKILTPIKEEVSLEEIFYKNSLKWELSKKKSTELYLLKSFKNYIFYIKSLFNKLVSIPYYSETLALVIANKINDFFILISEDVSNLG